MRRQEAESTKRRRRANLQKLILESVTLAGILGIALLAPNVLGAMAKMGMMATGRQAESIHRARRRLIEKGLLIYKNGSLCLTNRGEQYLRRLSLSDFGKQRPRRWDGKWRILIFDVPNRRRGLRDKVRHALTAIGFQKLQQSVWVYPFDCEDLFALLKADLRIGRDLQYIIADSIEYDHDLRKHFELPPAN